MKIRSRTAAKVAGVVGASALVLGITGPAGAATQDVEYALDAGTVTVGANTYVLPAATGLIGTWDDDTGDFDAAFLSEAVATQQTVAAPIPGTIDLTYQFVANGNVTGNIDPGTGAGTLNASFDVVITLQQLVSDLLPEPLILDQICTIADVPVAYSVTATGLGSGSQIFTDLSMSASGFAAPAATCVAGPAGDPNLTATVEENLNTSTGLPTQSTASEIALIAGAVPPPSTTTTTAATPTTAPTSSTTTPSGGARPVQAQPRFTG